jgi:hypothetical protein
MFIIQTAEDGGGGLISPGPRENRKEVDKNMRVFVIRIEENNVINLIRVNVETIVFSSI